MSDQSATSSGSFDSYAEDYETHLQRGLRLSGESSNYFATTRIRQTSALLKALDAPSAKILDYGCGTGNATACPLINAVFRIPQAKTCADVVCAAGTALKLCTASGAAMPAGTRWNARLSLRY